MQVVYDLLPSQSRDSLCRDHPRGKAVADAIDLDLSRDPFSRAFQIKNGRLAQVYSPPVDPRVEILVVYLASDDRVLVKKFHWAFIFQ